MVEDSHPIHLQTISCSTDARRFLQVRMSAVPSEQVCDWVHSRSVRNAYPTVIIPKKDRAVRWVAYRTCSASWIKWWDNNFIRCHWWQQWQIKMGNEPPASMYGVSLQERSHCFVSVTLLFWVPSPKAHSNIKVDSRMDGLCVQYEHSDGKQDTKKLNAQNAIRDEKSSQK